MSQNTSTNTFFLFFFPLPIMHSHLAHTHAISEPTKQTHTANTREQCNAKKKIMGKKWEKYT